MAISDSQKIDLLWKKVGFGKAKTDTNDSKKAPNEPNSSSLIIKDADIWNQSGSIPSTIPSANTSIVELYLDSVSGTLDTEYNNGAISNVTGDGSDFFKREVTTNGVRIMGAGTVGGQTAVPDAWLEKVGRMFELFTDPNGAGINEEYQRNLIKTLRGDEETYHAGLPTIQRVARGAGADYSPNFLTDQGVIDWNLTNLFDTHVQNDMVWYLNSTGDGYGDGDTDAQEVIEHVFHTIHMHGLPADDIKLYNYLASDWASGDLYAAMEEAYDDGYWDSSGYGGNTWKTDSDAFEVAAKEYLYLLNFCMFEYTELWDGGSLAPEWSDDMRTQTGIQANNPLGYAFHNTHIAPVISKPSLATIRSIFQDGNTPAQDNPSLAGASGYVVDTATGALETTEDGSSTDNRTWKTGVTNWIPPQFGSTYQLKVYAAPTGTANVQTSGTQLFETGSGNSDEWYFDYQSGILNFIGDNLPGDIGTGTSNVIHVAGAVYVGNTGVTSQGTNMVYHNFATLAATFASTTIEAGDFVKVDDGGDGEYRLYIANQADPSQTSHLTLIGTADSATTDAGTLTATFDYSAGSVLLGNISEGCKVTSVTVTTNIAFNDNTAEVTVGDAGDNERLMTADENDLLDVFSYESTPSYVYGAGDTDVYAYLSPGTASQGNVTVSVSYK